METNKLADIYCPFDDENSVSQWVNNLPTHSADIYRRVKEDLDSRPRKRNFFL